jgi:hypothetical protein
MVILTVLQTKSNNTQSKTPRDQNTNGAPRMAKHAIVKVAGSSYDECSQVAMLQPLIHPVTEGVGPR